MAARTIRRAAYASVGVLGVVLAVVALFLLSRTAQNSEDFDRFANTILLVNIAGLLVLFLLLIGNLTRLIREYRGHVPGSKLKARMVTMFVGLAVLPLLVVFYFSMQFINRGIDTWFNVEVEEGLDDALALSQRGAGATDARAPQYHDRAASRTRLRESSRGSSSSTRSGRLRRRVAVPVSWTVFGRNSQILATSAESRRPGRCRGLAERRSAHAGAARIARMLGLTPLESGALTRFVRGGAAPQPAACGRTSASC